MLGYEAKVPYDLVLDKECPFDSLASLCNEMVKQRLSQEYQLVDHFYDVEKYKKMVGSRSRVYSARTQTTPLAAPGGMGVFRSQNEQFQQQQRMKRDSATAPGTSATSTNLTNHRQSTNWINQVMNAFTGQPQPTNSE